MSKKTVAALRTICALLGAILIVVGLWPILIRAGVGFAADAAKWIDHEVWASLPQRRWWPLLLAAVTLATLAMGLWMLISTVRVRRVSSYDSAASDTAGAITVDLNGVTGGIAKSVGSRDGILKAHRTLAFERDEPRLTFTIEADPFTPWEQVVELAAETERDFRAAFPGTTVASTYRLYYGPVTARPSRG